MIPYDFHMHTTCCDGKNTPEEMAEAAYQKGMQVIGFSGHMDPDIFMDIPIYLHQLRALQAQYRGKMDILLGVELDNLYDPACTKDVEYWIGSTHFMEKGGKIIGAVDLSEVETARICREYFGGDYYAMCREYYRLEAQIYDKTHCTFVGHFDLITRFNDQMHAFDESDPRYLAPAKEAMEYLCKQGVPFEINCGAYNRGRKCDFYPRKELLQTLLAMGGRIPQMPTAGITLLPVWQMLHCRRKAADLRSTGFCVTMHRVPLFGKPCPYEH